LQLEPSTRVTQAQVGFSAHSASQLHALPPLAFSSQYQPAGQMPLPHLLQVPSSQLGAPELSLAPLLDAAASSASGLAAEPPSRARRPDSAEPPGSFAADLGSSLVAGPLPQPGSKTRAKQQKTTRILASVYVSWRKGYKGLWIWRTP